MLETQQLFNTSDWDTEAGESLSPGARRGAALRRVHGEQRPVEA